MECCARQVRCVLPALADPQARCTRCIRLKMECVYKPRGSRYRCARVRGSLLSSAVLTWGLGAVEALVADLELVSPSPGELVEHC